MHFKSNNTYHKRNFGSIECIVGPMFCGKTTELLRRVNLSRIAKLNVRLYKPAMDKRYSIDKACTHDNVQADSQLVDDADDVQKSLEKEQDRIHVVAIDEIQFIRGKIVEVCAQLRDQGIRVIAAGLDMDFRRQPFGEIGNLMAIADEVIKLKAVCQDCGENASFSKRLTQSQEVVQVGGKEEYAAVCEACYIKPKEESNG